MQSILRIKQRRSISRGQLIRCLQRLIYCPEQDASSLLDAQNALHDGLFG